MSQLQLEPPLPTEKWPNVQIAKPISILMPANNYYSVATSVNIPHIVFSAAVYQIRQHLTFDLLDAKGDIGPQDTILSQEHYENNLIYHAKGLLITVVDQIVDYFNNSPKKYLVDRKELLHLMTDVVYVRLLCPGQPFLFESEGEIQCYETFVVA